MDKIVSVRQCAAERGAFCVVRAFQGIPWTAGLHCRQRTWRIFRWHSLVGVDGPQLACLGCSYIALCLARHPQGVEWE